MRTKKATVSRHGSILKKAVGSSEVKPQVVTDWRFAFASAMKDEDPRLPEAIEKWKSSFSALERNFVTYKNLLDQIQEGANSRHFLTVALEQAVVLQRRITPRPRSFLYPSVS